MTIWFVLRTVALIGDVSSNLHTVILAFTGCAISVGFLCFIFGPKFYIAFSGKGDSMGGTSDHPEVALQEKERIQKEGQVRAEIPTANKKPNSPQTSATDAPAHESTLAIHLPVPISMTGPGDAGPIILPPLLDVVK
ncbi:hypothetical protein SARC_03197 [Sphaeroforma arctica JP610]|uniref:Uncharacterized protein n=1 Tax=Sphaeroforma arctica JP610 TaxID=667725 RepID=A0A0L0G6G6_9EUKA|nr:hypothetical protein SARC_03197 [Sphaeroforma arctica JP610]KNC84600.1 hypothetical protein SARC_03197 [Sphaeroforma arctica JP610]|eukprot:XP_014158502.1 hypothetical protein SARC_03197 [Sphaeroforma arctica JP610]